MNQTFLKKIWHFIWDDDSIWSWLANIIIAFVLIKFIVYPSLGFLLGTPYPIVAVVSGSMEHNNAFDTWWNTPCCLTKECTSNKTQTNIYKPWNVAKKKFITFPFTSGFNKGDIMILSSPTNLNQGDVIVFLADGRSDPIIHRLLNISNEHYNTQGDNNCGATADFEHSIPQEHLLGKASFRLPLLGWLKIFFVNLLKLTKVI